MISIIMPVYNESKYLGASIQGIIKQTYKDWELIIVDDCSTDNSVEIIQGYRLRYPQENIRLIRKNENGGHTKSLNIALKNIKGDYIAMQDADDISYPERLQKQIKVLRSGDIGLVSTYGIAINKDGNRVRDWYNDVAQRKPAKEIKKAIKNDCWILGPSMMWTKEVFNKIGYFDEKLYFGNDVNYWIRAMAHFKWTRVEEELYKKRRHPYQVRKQHPELNSTNWHALAYERAFQCPRIDV